RDRAAHPPAARARRGNAPPGARPGAEGAGARRGSGGGARVPVAGPDQQAAARPDPGAEEDPVKATLRSKLDSLVGRLEQLNGLLAAENATKDLAQFRNLSREHAEVSEVVALFQQYRQAEGDAEAARELALDEELKGA